MMVLRSLAIHFTSFLFSPSLCTSPSPSFLWDLHFQSDPRRTRLNFLNLLIMNQHYEEQTCLNRGSPFSFFLNVCSPCIPSDLEQLLPQTFNWWRCVCHISQEWTNMPLLREKCLFFQLSFMNPTLVYDTTGNQLFPYISRADSC